ncbi:MAG: tRNA (cytidine(34)-2'-O)-methyltransferase [Snowella sp.]|nr:tRNA (cytidine(34)-2'-O)-methyltransferase [Snowella sp.]
MLKVVLVHPQIPPNTGNIARTCAATETELHLVGPLGFELSDRYLKRAGLDYWPYVNLHYHPTLQDFQEHYQGREGRLIGFSVSGQKSYTAYHFQPEDWLVFGSESDGLPRDFREQCTDLVYIPMPQSHIRSLNLSVSVGVGLFEVYRQLGSFETKINCNRP